ncbi:MAG: helix-turn-helix domain-containing protein [Caldilineaceae bacterium SB0662_bin_9]|uniref:Helix-turn-helix domain-containing protein n=1 Tax=Caldilineaceae bacterium SB0662_bin_9 TaxID=2605258 RepID=A0A6B1DSY5_9CHLR|nr:helix-turn-helix domain-containing protein [Caldilineaceae bacterium SB0662_bin_9]
MGICHRSRCRCLSTPSNRLAGQAGACCFVWNHFLSRQQQEYAACQAGTHPDLPIYRSTAWDVSYGAAE